VWLDLENLIPGTQIAPTCNAAAKNAQFRFAFVSEDYFKSKNCGVEWVEIKDQPERSFIFAYPSTPDDKIKLLQDSGHKVFKTPEVAQIDASWLNENLIQSRATNVIFAIKTPPINEKWLPTLRFYFAEPDWEWLKITSPMIFFFVALLVYHIAFISAYNIWQCFTGTSSVVGYICFLYPLIGIIACAYVMWAIHGTGFKKDYQLVRAVQLLYLLKYLDIIDTQTFYTNCAEDIPGLHDLEKLNIIKIVDDMNVADVRILNIDNLKDLPVPRPQDSIWASKGFMELDQSVRDRLGSFLIGSKKDICEVEFVSCKVLMAAFRCQSTDSLSVGSLGWERLNLKSSVGSS